MIMASTNSSHKKRVGLADSQDNVNVNNVNKFCPEYGQLWYYN